MKKLQTYKQFINEGTDVNSIEKRNEKYYPKDREELKLLIDTLIAERGDNADLNDIDVSNVTDMHELFKGYKNFNGDISKWDVSKVTDMKMMFCRAESFNQPIGNWDVSNVEEMEYMFKGASSFNQDLSSWNTSMVNKNEGIFWDCPIKTQFKPYFENGDEI